MRYTHPKRRASSAMVRSRGYAASWQTHDMTHEEGKLSQSSCLSGTSLRVLAVAGHHPAGKCNWDPFLKLYLIFASEPPCKTCRKIFLILTLLKEECVFLFFSGRGGGGGGSEAVRSHKLRAQ